MIAGVITTPNRQQYLYDLIPQIAPYVDKFFIFNDTQRQGHVFNLRRCMATVLPLAKENEPVLIMADDVTAVADWKNRFAQLRQEVDSPIYQFFTRQKHLLKFKEKGYAQGIFKRGFYDHAFILINQQDLIPKIDTWFETRGKDLIPEPRQKHYDVIIQEYLIDNQIEWVITVPTLFEHIGEISTLGHNIGGSICFAGEE